jgi:hypothetical protein
MAHFSTGSDALQSTAPLDDIPTEEMWQIVNKEIGNSSQVHYPTSLKKGNEKTSNPQDMANMINSYFIESVDELLVNNLNPYVNQISNTRIINQLNTMFWLPVTEMEIGRVIKTLKRKTLCRH